MNNDPTQDDAFLNDLKKGILKHYYYYIELVKKKRCTLKQIPIYSLSEPFNVDIPALEEAVSDIKMDINILHLRRGGLIENFRTSEGKIAGIIAYRLAKTHIMNTSYSCNNDCNIRCLARLNVEIAIRCACDYIHKTYPKHPEGIRQELFYTIRHRHVNQEMIGLVFDALLGEAPHVNENTEKLTG